MKRWIYASTRQNAVAFVDQINQLLKSQRIKGHSFTVLLYNDDDIRHPSYWINFPGAPYVVDGFYLDEYYDNWDVEGAAKVCKAAAQQMVTDKKVVFPEDYDEFLNSYSKELTSISRIVSNVATAYDSDMQYKPRLAYLVRSILQYDLIRVTESDVILSYACGLDASSYRQPGQPVSYTDGIIEIPAPSGIYFKGNDVKISLKDASSIQLGCKQLQSGLEDYFESIKWAYETDDSPRNYPGKARAGGSHSSVKLERKEWSNVLEGLQADIERGIVNPIYKGTPSGAYLNRVAGGVERKLFLYVDCLVDKNSGGVWIYNNRDKEEALVEDYDFDAFSNSILDIAFESKTLAEFKEKYATYLKNLIK